MTILRLLVKDLFSRVNIQKHDIDIYCDINRVSDSLRTRLHKYYHVIRVNDCSGLSVDFIIKFHNV